MSLQDVRHSIGEDIGGLFVKSSQEIHQDFLDECRAEYDASLMAPAKNYHRVASIPVSVVELWRSQGFDVYREKPAAIVARLKAHSLDTFITTKRRV